jgi:hypothetical protein
MLFSVIEGLFSDVIFAACLSLDFSFSLSFSLLCIILLETVLVGLYFLSKPETVLTLPNNSWQEYIPSRLTINEDGASEDEEATEQPNDNHDEEDDETTEEEKEESNDDKQVSDDDEEEESQNTVGQTQCISLESQQIISAEVDEVEETCELSLTSSPYAAPITFFMKKKN